MIENRGDAAKSSLKRLGKPQRKMDIARPRRFHSREILQYHLTTSIDTVDLGLGPIMLVNLKSFWSSASDKHKLQVASRTCFQNKPFLNEINIILRAIL